MNKTAIQYGIIGGAASIIFSLVLYIIGIEAFTNGWLTLLALLIYPIFMIVGGLAVRKANGGLLSYKDSLFSVFTIAAIGSLLGSVFMIILYNVINPELPQIVSDIQIEKTIGWMEKFGAPEAQIEESLTELEKLPEQFTPVGIIVQWAKWLVAWFVLSLLFALIPKKTEEGIESASSEA